MKKKLTDHTRLLFIFIFSFIVFCPVSVNAQIITDEDRKGILPSQMLDTRSLSMGNTTVADVLGMTSIGMNAAISGLYDGPAFIQLSSRHSWEINLMQHNLQLPTFTIGPHHFTTRFGFVHKGFEGLPFTSSSDFLQPDLNMYQAEFGYAVLLGDHFSLGTIQSASLTSNKEQTQYWNYRADLGLLYAPDGPVSYGLAFRGIGNETTYKVNETGLTTFNTRLATQILEIGVTLRYPIEDRTYLSLSFANEKRFGEDGLWYKGGIEISPVSFIQIRGGIMVNFDQTLFVPRMGMGYRVGMFRFDYVMAPDHLIGERFHQFGMTIQF